MSAQAATNEPTGAQPMQVDPKDNAGAETPATSTANALGVQLNISTTPDDGVQSNPRRRRRSLSDVGGPSPTRSLAIPAPHSSDGADNDEEDEPHETTPTGHQFPGNTQANMPTPGSNLSTGEGPVKNPFEDSPLFELPFPQPPLLHDGKRHLDFHPIPESLRSPPFRVYVKLDYPTRGLSTLRRDMWAEAGNSSGSVFGVILSEKITEKTSTQIYQNVTNAIRRMFPDSPTALVSLPDTTPYGRNGEKEIPGINCRTAILISNLTLLTASILEHHQLWISEKVRFIALPYPLPPSPYIGTFSGLPYLPENEAEVLEAFCRGYRESYEITTFFHANGLDLIGTIASMAVKPVKMSVKGDYAYWVWNLYTKPPSNTVAVHKAYCKMVCETTFVAFGGSANCKRPFIPCLTCRSEDHPQGHCPLRPILADLDASIMEREASNAPTQSSGSARGGNRGRGSSRGG